MRRFAIYYAPPDDTALAAFGRRWIGRDHVTGAQVEPPAVPGLSGERQRALTAFPRHYGFHATLKAPFELHPERTRSQLITALLAFAAHRSPFEAPPVEPMNLAGFIAFKLTAPSAAMDRLAADCVRTFEPFRAPLRRQQIERRRSAGLTDRQEWNLVTWGYPYVFEEFRFHMTLTGPLDQPERDQVLALLRGLAAPILTQPLRVEAVSLYEQAADDQPFLLTASFPFGAV